MAHTKAKGSTKLGRDSQAKRLGIKIFGGQNVKVGQIIIRQRGTSFHPGEGVGLGKDHTIFAAKDGKVNFGRKKLSKYTGLKKLQAVVSVR